MKQIYRFDSNGFYIEPLLIDDKMPIPNDCTEIKPIDGLYKAQFVNGAWVEAETSATLLQYAKDAKKAELNMKCDLAIMGGFTSSALGVEHTYSSVLTDEIWYNATKNRFDIDAAFASVDWKTIDAGYLTHTKAQFQQVFIDGHAFGNSQIAHRNDLNKTVDDPTTDTVEKVKAITW
jgi:hypothetical protein